MSTETEVPGAPGVVRCPLCGEAVTMPPDGVPSNRYDSMEVIRAARTRLKAEQVHLATHTPPEWANEVIRLQLELAERNAGLAAAERGVAGILAALVSRLGGSAHVTARELVTLDYGRLSYGRDPDGGLVFTVRPADASSPE